MGLFDKKYCDVCGEKIGLMGNRKLSDGNLCKNCAAKLSPWFSERRQSTVADIKAQLADRAANEERLDAFQVTRRWGERGEVRLDDGHGWFCVKRNGDVSPDVLELSQVTGCEVKVTHSQVELKDKDAEGKEVSFNPPRHRHHYDFDLLIQVNHPWFDDMRFRYNDHPAEILTGVPAAQLTGVLAVLNAFTPPATEPDTAHDAEYQRLYRMGEEMCAALLGQDAEPLQADAAAEAEAPAADSAADVAAPAEAAAPGEAPKQLKFCPYCGTAFDTPRPRRFCEHCGEKL